jgi:hypothetical protein
MTTTASSSARPRTSRWPRLLILAVGGLVGLGAIGLALVPTIAGSIGPGMIEDAAKTTVKGSVKVGALNVGWFSPTSVGPVEVRNDAGKLAAKLDISAPVTLMQVVRERWWSARSIDVGTIQLAGNIELERDEKGQTNLERAIELRQPAPAKPAAASSGGLEALKAALNISKLDIVIREKVAGGGFGPDMGVRDLKGTASIDFAGPSVKLAADLAGNPVGVAAAQPTKLKIDASASSTGQRFAIGALEKSSIKAEVANAPVPVIDALAGLSGGLVSAVGPTAEISIDGSGTLQKGSAKVRIASSGIDGAFDLSLADGIIVAQGGPTSNSLKVRSTEFLSKLPQTRDALAEITKQVKLTGPAPSLDLTIEQLKFPMPVQGSGSGSGSIDARGSSVSIVLGISGMQGQLALAGAGQAAAASAAPTDWRPFSVEPVRIALAAPDLSKPLTLEAGTTATIDNQPAGAVTLKVVATGLVDAAGKLRATLASSPLAERVKADVKVQGMSTALIQPIVAGTGLPLDLRADIGPTLDATIAADVDTSNYVPSSPSAPLPPMDVALDVQSGNIRASGKPRIENNTLSVGPEGLTLNVNAAGPLAARILAAQPNPPATIAGTGQLAVTFKDVSVALDKLKGDDAMGNIRARVDVAMRDLAITPASPAGAAPVEVQDAAIALALAPNTAPQLTHSANLRHAGQPFQSQAEVSFEGLKTGRMPSGAGLDLAFRLSASGAITLSNVPRSVLALAPGLGAMLDDSSADNLARMAQGAIGRHASLTVNFSPVAGTGGARSGGGTNAVAKLSTDAKGIAGELVAEVTSTQATLSGARLRFVGDPGTLNPVLAQGSTPGATPMRIGRPFTIDLEALQPISVPLVKQADGSLAPDLARASEAQLAIKTDNDIVLDNVSVGTDPAGRPNLTQLQFRNLSATTRLPIAALASSNPPSGSTPAQSSLTAQILKGDGGKVADVSAQLAGLATPASPIQSADVKLASVDVVAVDTLLGQGGTLVGALGATMNADVKVTPRDAQARSLDVVADIKAPKFAGATINMLKQNDTLVLQRPTTITWSPDAAFVNSALLKADKPEASFKLTQLSPLTIQLTALAIAMSNADASKGPVQGPMKPGVFALDVGISSAQLAGSIASGPGQPPTPIAITGLQLSAKSSGQTAGQLDASAVMESISAAGAAPARAVVNARVRNLADSVGNVQTAAATYDLDADLPSFPTPVIDQFAKQNGFLNEALGPTVSIKARAANIVLAQGSPQTGTLEATATSPRASAELLGEVRNGAFIQTGKVDSRVIEIRPQELKFMGGFLPLVQTVEKSTQDQPAVITGKDMQVPIDGDMRKLNGVVTIDPGVARFATSSVLGELIQLAGGKAQGTLGNRIEPFVVNIKNGVASYDRFTLPLGQFNLETTGVVDLVNRQIDVVTYVPLFSLTASAAGGLNTGIAGKLGVLDKNTQVPISTTGSLDNPTTKLDLARFAKEAGDRLLKEPGKLIEKGLDDALKNLFDKPKKDPKK